MLIIFKFVITKTQETHKMDYFEQIRTTCLSILNLFLFATLTISCGSKYPTKVIAHRGGAKLAPENTMPAFKRALDLKVDFFELDVHLSADDSLVLIHDASLNRTTNGSGKVSETTFNELKKLDAGSWFSADFANERVPLLRDALLLAKNSNYPVEVVIELKSSEKRLPSKVVALVRELELEERVIISSFNFNLINTSKQIAPEIRVQLFGIINRDNINKVKQINGEWVGSGGAILKDIVDFAHSQNIKFNCWTINNDSVMTELIKMNVDAITTDKPDLLLKVLTRKYTEP